MTSKLTKEWLQHQISAIQAVGITDSNTLAAFKLALAALDSEPVAYISKSDFDAGYPHILARRDFNKACTMAVYAAQPAPVVPKSISVRQAISALESADAVTTIGQAYKMGWNACRAAMLQELQKSAGAEVICRSNENVQALNTIKATPALVSLPKTGEVQNTNSPAIPNGYVMVPKEPTEAMMLHNSGCQHHAWDDPDCAMRQTRRLIWSHMLAAAPQSPGSEPATVPGKWIPVSVRMPDREVDVQVYCPDKKEQMVAYLERNELEGYFRFATWRTGDGIYCQPTHWMQLPAGPREVKGE
ncbi:TPA: DUF551 domain-containing protein [Klebsiella quasipneumoniae subsp. similipneumoniae]|nr:DUF551 domain-containing protein [Klebsiella quasipneumoniae subsp. similipneumoniae]